MSNSATIAQPARGLRTGNEQCISPRSPIPHKSHVINDKIKTKRWTVQPASSEVLADVRLCLQRIFLGVVSTKHRRPFLIKSIGRESGFDAALMELLDESWSTLLPVETFLAIQVVMLIQAYVKFIDVKVDERSEGPLRFI